MILPIFLVAAATDLNLICTGRAETEDSSPTITTTYSQSGTSYSGGSETVVKGMTDTLALKVVTDGGEARLPQIIRPPFGSNRDGWYSLKKVLWADNEITARVRYNGIASAKLRLDRITGMVTVDGSAGRFSGTCAPYDPATVNRKF